RAYDFVYIAPPQYKGMWAAALQALEANPAWLHPEGSAIVQIDPTENEPLTLTRFAQYDERRYGNTLLLFLRPEHHHPEEQSRG
ncbi:MAG: RsmD family RNA methyltransferase, partial [Anaerolineae bacterium]|nr:RsmD family RNA methyltransferase [Anaerolineae bacterium]